MNREGRKGRNVLRKKGILIFLFPPGFPIASIGGKFINFEAIAKLFVGGPVAIAVGPYADLVLALTTLFFGLWFLKFLYERRIFLRV